MVQADVEPDRRIERAVLVQAQPRQLAVEPLAVFLAGKVTVRLAPVGDRSCHPLDQLADARLSLARARLTVEVLADHHVGRQRTPVDRNLAVDLLEQHAAVLVLDRRSPQVPLDRVERIRVGRTELRPKLQGLARRLLELRVTVAVPIAPMFC